MEHETNAEQTSASAAALRGFILLSLEAWIIAFDAAPIDISFPIFLNDARCQRRLTSGSTIVEFPLLPPYKRCVLLRDVTPVPRIWALAKMPDTCFWGNHQIPAHKRERGGVAEIHCDNEL